MNAFELFCYAVAIVAILGFFGDRHTTTEPATVTPAPAADAASEPTTPPAELPTITVTTEPATVTPAPAESTPAPAESTPATAESTPATDLQALTVTELRRLATLARYPWRNAHGPNRHATKRELIAALS